MNNMEYFYRGITFSSSDKYFRVSHGRSSVSSNQGITTITVEPEKEIPILTTTKLEEVYLNYNGLIFRRRNTESISITIVKILDLKDLYVESSLYSLVVLLPQDYNIKELSNDLQGDHLEYIEGDAVDYVEVVGLTLNKSRTVEGSSNPIDFSKGKYRYDLDMTMCLSSLYDELEAIVKPELPEFLYQYETREVDCQDYAKISFDEYALKFKRLLPNFNGDCQEYTLPIQLKLFMSSVSQFERLLADINSNKFLTNFTKYEVEDNTGLVWWVSLWWDSNVDTSSPNEARNSDSESGYEITLRFSIRFYIVRANRYRTILEILRTLNHVTTSIK